MKSVPFTLRDVWFGKALQNIRLVERWCLVRPGEGLDRRKTERLHDISEPAFSSYFSDTVPQKSRFSDWTQFIHSCSLSTVLSVRGLFWNLYIFLPVQTCVFPFLYPFFSSGSNFFFSLWIYWIIYIQKIQKEILTYKYRNLIYIKIYK